MKIKKAEKEFLRELEWMNNKKWLTEKAQDFLENYKHNLMEREL